MQNLGLKILKYTKRWNKMNNFHVWLYLHIPQNVDLSWAKTMQENSKKVCTAGTSILPSNVTVLKQRRNKISTAQNKKVLALSQFAMMTRAGKWRAWTWHWVKNNNKTFQNNLCHRAHHYSWSFSFSKPGLDVSQIETKRIYCFSTSADE